MDAEVWVEAAAQFASGAEWSRMVEEFLDSKCAAFAGADAALSSGSGADHSLYESYSAFCNLRETLVATMAAEVGADPARLETQLQAHLRTASGAGSALPRDQLATLFQYDTAAHAGETDFHAFCRSMAARAAALSGAAPQAPASPQTGTARAPGTPAPPLPAPSAGGEPATDHLVALALSTADPDAVAAVAAQALSDTAASPELRRWAAAAVRHANAGDRVAAAWGEQDETLLRALATDEAESRREVKEARDALELASAWAANAAARAPSAATPAREHGRPVPGAAVGQQDQEHLTPLRRAPPQAGPGGGDGGFAWWSGVWQDDDGTSPASRAAALAAELVWTTHAAMVTADTVAACRGRSLARASALEAASYAQAGAGLGRVAGVPTRDSVVSANSAILVAMSDAMHKARASEGAMPRDGAGELEESDSAAQAAMETGGSLAAALDSLGPDAFTPSGRGQPSLADDILDWALAERDSALLQRRVAVLLDAMESLNQVLRASGDVPGGAVLVLDPELLRDSATGDSDCDGALAGPAALPEAQRPVASGTPSPRRLPPLSRPPAAGNLRGGDRLADQEQRLPAVEEGAEPPTTLLPLASGPQWPGARTGRLAALASRPPAEPTAEPVSSSLALGPVRLPGLALPPSRDGEQGAAITALPTEREVSGAEAQPAPGGLQSDRQRSGGEAGHAPQAGRGQAHAGGGPGVRQVPPEPSRSAEVSTSVSGSPAGRRDSPANDSMGKPRTGPVASASMSPTAVPAQRADSRPVLSAEPALSPPGQGTTEPQVGSGDCSEGLAPDGECENDGTLASFAGPIHDAASPALSGAPPVEHGEAAPQAEWLSNEPEPTADEPKHRPSAGLDSAVALAKCARESEQTGPSSGLVASAGRQRTWDAGIASSVSVQAGEAHPSPPPGHGARATMLNEGSSPVLQSLPPLTKARAKPKAGTAEDQLHALLQAHRSNLAAERGARQEVRAHQQGRSHATVRRNAARRNHLGATRRATGGAMPHESSPPESPSLQPVAGPLESPASAEQPGGRAAECLASSSATRRAPKEAASWSARPQPQAAAAEAAPSHAQVGRLELDRTHFSAPAATGAWGLAEPEFPSSSRLPASSDSRAEVEELVEAHQVADERLRLGVAMARARQRRAGRLRLLARQQRLAQRLAGQQRPASAGAARGSPAAAPSTAWA